MKDALKKYSKIPGLPRIIYLCWYDDTDPAYNDRMRMGLADESVPYTWIMGLIYVKEPYLTRKIDLTALQTSEERRKLIVTTLENAPKSK
jgi:hypothetical protein